jgi:hypothetical protein
LEREKKCHFQIGYHLSLSRSRADGGMVQAWVGQNQNFLNVKFRVFTMYDFIHLKEIIGKDT